MRLHQMFANRILANHVSRVTGLAMLGATLLLLLLQILFTYLGELGELKDNYNAWAALRYVLWESPRYLYELLPITEGIRQGMHPDVDMAKIKRAAIQEGLRPLRLAGAMKVAEGLTTLEEVLRNTPHWEG